MAGTIITRDSVTSRSRGCKVGHMERQCVFSEKGERYEVEQTFVSEQLAGDDRRHEHGLIDLQLGFLQVAEELGDDGAEGLDTHDQQEEVKGLREELESLGLCPRGDEFILWTFDFH